MRVVLVLVGGTSLVISLFGYSAIFTTKVSFKVGSPDSANFLLLDFGVGSSTPDQVVVQSLRY